MEDCTPYITNGSPSFWIWIMRLHIKGAENKVADALSRINEGNKELCQISLAVPQWQNQARDSYGGDNSA